MLPIRDRLPTRRLPIVNYLLIAANVLAFIWERAAIGSGFSPRWLLASFGLVPRLLIDAPVDHAFSVLTSMFLHDPSGWLHIGGNMLFLWIFGDNVEDAMGHARYLAFYLISGVVAAAAQILVDPSSGLPMVGASGAIAGVLAAYVSLYPRAPITVLNPIPILWLFFGLFLELPAWFVIGEFFVVNLLNGLLRASMPGETGGIAFFAHIGGFVAGLILVRLFARRVVRPVYDRWSGLRPPPRRVYRDPRYPPRPFPPERRDPWA